jgi:hypothetical protein
LCSFERLAHGVVTPCSEDWGVENAAGFIKVTVPHSLRTDFPPIHMPGAPTTHSPPRLGEDYRTNPRWSLPPHFPEG